MPDIRLRQSARFPRGTVQVSVPDVFGDWAAPGWVETPEAAPLAPAYEITIDWRTSDGVIDETQALATAVMVALGSDLLADLGDELPDTLDSDRRGWWGDMDAESIWDGWPLGTRLWEMRRDAIRDSGYKFGATTVKAENFVREAIQPFVTAGIISKYTVEVEKVTSERIDVLILLFRTRSPAISLRYAYLYDEIGRSANFPSNRLDIRPLPPALIKPLVDVPSVVVVPPVVPLPTILASESNLVANALLRSRMNAALSGRGDLVATPVPAAGGGPFTPADLPGLVAWYSADTGVYSDAGTTLATNGQAVAQWNDQSGHGYHLISNAPGASPPTYGTTGFNGGKTINFPPGTSGFSTSLNAVVIGTGTVASAFIAGQMLSTTASNGRAVSYIATGQAADYNNIQSAALIHRNSSFDAVMASRGSLPLSAVAASPSTNYRIGSIFDGANNTVYLNNVASTPVASTGNFGSPGTLSASVAGSYWVGPISEIVITNTALTSTERTNLDAYFVAKWGLSADPDVAAWKAAVGASNVSSGREALITNLVTGLKTDGVWPLLDRLWIFAAENTNSALVDLKARATATPVNFPAFTTDVGYEGNIAPAYIDTNYNLSTDSVNYTQNFAHLSVWNLIDFAFNAYTLGTSINGGLYDGIYARFNDGNTYMRVNDAAPVGDAFILADCRGFLLANRSGPMAREAYRNGVSVNTYGPMSAIGLTNETFRLFISKWAVMSCGGSLNATQQLAFYNRLRTYLTAVGVP